MIRKIRITNRIFIRYSLFIFANCQLLTANCQNDVLKYAHQIVDTLASPSMYGRGYIMKGDSIAADYIKKQFEKIGLKPIEKEFYQRFSFPVNTFPGGFGWGFRGIDKYFETDSFILVNPNSPHTEYGNYKVIWFDSSVVSSKKNLNEFEKNNFSDKVIVIDSKGVSESSQMKLIENAKQNPYHSKAIVIFNNKKLTWDASQTLASIPTFEILVPDCDNKIWHEQLEHFYFFVESKFIPNYQSQNVIGYIRGTQYPDSFIVFTAHYDHLGMMDEEAEFPGANDNASGCAMLLNLARYYSQHPLKYSVAFMAFGAEEVGLIGSKYYVEHQLFNINQIKFLINFDIVGTGDEGIKVVNATQHKKEFDELVKINEEKKYLPSVQPRGKASISDHYFFEEAGVKTFYIYTLGGIKAYHDIYDRPETLPLTKFEELYKLVIDFSDTLQK